MCPEESRNAPPRFLADAMLGRLARWLRVVGFDTAFEPALPDPAQVRLARDEHRILLTRDRHLIRELRPPRIMEITSDAPLEQLGQVVHGYGLRPPRELFTRCLLCNSELALIPPGEAAELLPPRARELPGPVRSCPVCQRIYWRGSHVRRMHAALDAALPGWLETSPHPTP